MVYLCVYIYIFPVYIFNNFIYIYKKKLWDLYTDSQKKKKKLLSFFIHIFMFLYMSNDSLVVVSLIGFLFIFHFILSLSFSKNSRLLTMVDLQTVCCMCGDVGFPDKLFRCNKCRNRIQHSYEFHHHHHHHRSFIAMN